MLGDKLTSVAESARIQGVSKVVVIDHPALKNALAENFTSAISGLVKSDAFTHVLMASSNFGKNVLPRLAALVDATPLVGWFSS